MENNKVLTDGVLRNRGIDSLLDLIIGIRKDLDVVLYEDCATIDSRTMISLCNISERIQSLYDSLYISFVNAR